MAKKATIIDVSTGYASGTTLDANFDALNDKFDNTLSLDGSTPNAMGADLDLNSYDILNGGTANFDDIVVDGSSVAGSAAAAAASATAAATSASEAATIYDNFDDRYLGAKVAEPTLDNDGDALTTGALYFNTVTDDMWVYTGTDWVAAYASLSGALVDTNNLSDLDDAATARANLGLEIGSDVQAYDADTAKTDVAETVTADWTFSGDATFTGLLDIKHGDDQGLRIYNTANDPIQLNANSAGAARFTTGNSGAEPIYYGGSGGPATAASGTTVLSRTMGDARYVEQSNLDLTMTDVTGSRTHSTSYQNTSGQTQVVQTYTNGAGTIRIQTSPDNSTWTDIGSATSGGFFWNNMFHVPNGSYWRINGTATVNKVYEGTVVGS